VRNQTTTPEAIVQDSIATGIGSVPDVEAVFALRQDQGFRVWIVVRDSAPEVRRRIYEKEKRIIDDYSCFDFDFNIVASRGRDARTVVADPAAELAYSRT
jgi:hypothetical protein